MFPFIWDMPFWGYIKAKKLIKLEAKLALINVQA